MSPVVRDGSNHVTEYRVEPVASPSGPVERVVEPSVVRRLAEAGLTGSPRVGKKRSPETRARMSEAHKARAARIRAEKAAADAAADIEAQGSEEGAPVTDAADVGMPVPLPPVTDVFPPPGPVIDGEDRCAFATWLASAFLLICDRPTGHAGSHRGRLLKTDWKAWSMVGCAAVAE